MVKVELTYNPYVPRLSITLDGREPDSYSRLIQYCDEPIYSWCDSIVDDVAAELRRDFSIEFVGLATHAALLRAAASRCDGCRDFREYRFEIDTPVNVRMGKLNQLLKANRNIRHSCCNVHVAFVVADSYAAAARSLESLAIANEYCLVTTEFVRLSEVSASRFDAGTYVILLSDSDSDISRMPMTSRPAFQARCGEADKIEGLLGGGVRVTSSIDIMDAVTTCLLDAPLTDAYVTCLGSLGDTKLPQELRAIEPTVTVRLNNKIELQRSNPIRLIVSPEGKRPPRVRFRVLDEQVAEADGLAVFGRKVGRTTLEAYYAGESIPFETIPVEVFRRNRITELILSDRSVAVGIGSRRRVSLEYVPEDADNASCIRWASTNPSIATVSSDGTIVAKNEGICDIIVSAEGVTAKCRCVAMPYLQELTVTMPLVKDDDGSYLMYPMQEASLEVFKVPSESIDGTLEVKSSAYDVVNVVGTTAIAKNSGDATLFISNVTGSKKATLRIRVNKQRQQQKQREYVAKQERELRRREREERKRAKRKKRQQEGSEGKKRFFGLFD